MRSVKRYSGPGFWREPSAGPSCDVLDRVRFNFLLVELIVEMFGCLIHHGYRCYRKVADLGFARSTHGRRFEDE